MTITYKNKSYKNKSYKNKSYKNNKTLKKKDSVVKFIRAAKTPKTCDVVSLVPFEKTYSKNLKNNSFGKNNIQIKKDFAKQLLSRFAPKNIKPEDDYYNYINYSWLKNITLTQKQKYIVQIDDFRLGQYNVYQELDKIIVDYFTSHNDRLSKCLKSFYNSVIQMNSIHDSRKVANDTLFKIDTLRKDKTNLWKMLAYVNKTQMTSSESPLSWTMLADDKNPEVFRPYIESFNFPITDFNVYFDNGTDVEYKSKYRFHFKKYCKELFENVFGKNHNMNTDNIYDVHVDIFNSFGCTDITKNPKIYNRVYSDESLTKYGFDWKEFTKELGFERTPRFFITSNLNYLKCVTTLLLENWDSEKWRPFWVWIFIRKIARITNEWRYIYYNFYGKFQQGEEDIVQSSAVSASLFMSVPFNAFLTNEYIKKFKNDKIVSYVNTMCNDLKIVFTRIINRNKWLSPSTKKYALMKLNHLQFTIGNPEVIRADPLLEYTDNFYDNLQKIYEWRHNKYLKLDGVSVFPIPLIDWTKYPLKLSGRQAYIVDASYTPSKNNIYINLGYMQKPFIDLGKSIEYNLAHLGFTISHEMSHSLDDVGSQYDYKGKLHNWWTEEDKKKYKRIQEDIIKQYEDWAKRDGVVFDATIGIGEDLADISGLAICDEYLMDYQTNENNIIPVKDLAYELFYTYYAIQMKQKIGKYALPSQLKTNPHPPDKYRTNVPLSRSQIFTALYNVKKGDGMWWNSFNTVW